MSRTKDHLIDHMNSDHYHPDCPCVSCKVHRGEGPLSMSEADLLALEQRGQSLVAAGKRVREHACHCEHSDQKTLDALDELLKYIGIHDQVIPPAAATRHPGEMGCTCGEDALPPRSW